MVIAQPAASRRLRRPRRGYNLVILMVLVTVMSILIAVALPTWSQVIKRQKEQELIFRGLQYAEAIRVFQARTGRYPVRLVELLETEPRSIRQLWTDPFRDDGKWGLILAQAAGGRQVGGDEVQGRAPTTGRATDEDEDSDESEQQIPIEDVSEDSRFGRPEGIQATGPVIGVRSLTEEEAVTSFLGSHSIPDWEFTAELIPVLPAGAVVENVPRLTSRYIGRSFPRNLEPQPGSLPGGLPGSPSTTDDPGRRRTRPAAGDDDE